PGRHVDGGDDLADGRLGARLGSNRGAAARDRIRRRSPGTRAYDYLRAPLTAPPLFSRDHEPQVMIAGWKALSSHDRWRSAVQRPLLTGTSVTHWDGRSVNASVARPVARYVRCVAF